MSCLWSGDNIWGVKFFVPFYQYVHGLSGLPSYSFQGNIFTSCWALVYVMKVTVHIDRILIFFTFSTTDMLFYFFQFYWHIRLKMDTVSPSKSWTVFKLEFSNHLEGLYRYQACVYNQDHNFLYIKTNYRMLNLFFLQGIKCFFQKQLF